MNFHFCPRRHECISWQGQRRQEGEGRPPLVKLADRPPGRLPIRPPSLIPALPHSLLSFLTWLPHRKTTVPSPLSQSVSQHEMSVGAALVLTRGQGGPPCQSCSLGRSAPSASAWATPVNGRSDDSGGWDGGGAMGGLGCNGGGGSRGSVVRGHSLSPSAAPGKQFPPRRLPSFLPSK